MKNAYTKHEKLLFANLQICDIVVAAIVSTA